LVYKIQMNFSTQNISYSIHSSTLDSGNDYELSNDLEYLRTVSLIKKGIWIYFLLLIFEGALRKWALPGIATPLLLIVRDPVAIWIIFVAWKRNLIPASIYLSGVVIAAIIASIAALFVGHGNLMVTIFGARILMLHFPVMFIIGRVFERTDVLQMGRVILWLALPITVLVALQFYSPQSAWVNRAVGGETTGAGFSGALGFFRPPATFSFTNGTTLFYSLVACYVIYFWLQGNINRLLLIASTLCLLAAIPLSISRALFFQVIISLVFACIAGMRNSKYMGRILMAAVGVVVLVIALSYTKFFQTALGAFLDRFDMANTAEGGVKGVVVDRYLGGMLGALSGAEQLPIFGYGIGMGTNVGSMLLAGGLTFLISEGEWGRLIGEMGAVLGLVVIILRIGIVLKIARMAYLRLSCADLLPWLLLSFGLLTVPQAQWGQATSLGFSTLIGGLMIASLNENNEIYESGSNIEDNGSV
jgi:hypothetical protein